MHIVRFVSRQTLQKHPRNPYSPLQPPWARVAISPDALVRPGNSAGQGLEYVTSPNSSRRIQKGGGTLIRNDGRFPMAPSEEKPAACANLAQCDWNYGTFTSR